jgi:hypothetical protein
VRSFRLCRIIICGRVQHTKTRAKLHFVIRITSYDTDNITISVVSNESFLIKILKILFYEYFVTKINRFREISKLTVHTGCIELFTTYNITSRTILETMLFFFKNVLISERNNRARNQNEHLKLRLVLFSYRSTGNDVN